MDDFDALFDSLKPETSCEIPREVSDEEYCEKCNANSVVNNNGEFICHQCGNVKGTMLDTTAEWRYYGNDDSKSSDPTRCGMPTNALLPESSYGSTIGFRSKESF